MNARLDEPADETLGSVDLPGDRLDASDAEIEWLWERMMSWYDDADTARDGEAAR